MSGAPDLQEIAVEPGGVAELLACLPARPAVAQLLDAARQSLLIVRRTLRLIQAAFSQRQKLRFSDASCTHIMIMLGANDAADHRTAAQFLTDMQTIIGPGTGSLVTAGYKVIVNYPTYIPAGANSGATDEAATENMRSYLAQIDSLVDGVDVLRGDTLAYQYLVDHPSEVQTDHTH